MWIAVSLNITAYYIAVLISPYNNTHELEALIMLIIFSIMALSLSIHYLLIEHKGENVND